MDGEVGMQEEIDRIAAQLLAARRDGAPIPPISERIALGQDEAYRVQLAQVDAWRREGRRVIGYKVGLTSRAIQRQLGVDQPDFGHLFDDDVVLSGEPIPAGRFIQPRVEPEIAFVLGRGLEGPGVTVADAIRAIDVAVASLEIIDSRIADWRITLPDTIADNASAGAVVLGTAPVALAGRDLRLTGGILRRNGRIVHTGAGAAVLGSPVSALVWLVNTLGRAGTAVEAGSVVLPGAITAAVPAEPGDVISADFAGLGSVTARFAVASAD
ncbi:MAG: 2-keto-4-pentenoate hydratase [Micrococcales bacterium 73-13]|nr:MAG: 2-keto-4-pentenoate hydratase [Micrococcales bacterium 73-13]